MKYLVLAIALFTVSFESTAQKKKSKEQAAPVKTETSNQPSAAATNIPTAAGRDTSASTARSAPRRRAPRW